MFPARYDSYLTSLFFFFLSLSLSLSLSRTILALHSLQCERSHGLLVTETTATVTHGVPTLVTMAEAEVMASVVVASVEVASVVVATVVVVMMVVLVVVVEWWGCWWWWWWRLAEVDGGGGGGGGGGGRGSGSGSGGGGVGGVGGVVGVSLRQSRLGGGGGDKYNHCYHSFLPPLYYLSGCRAAFCTVCTDWGCSIRLKKVDSRSILSSTVRTEERRIDLKIVNTYVYVYNFMVFRLISRMPSDNR